MPKKIDSMLETQICKLYKDGYGTMHLASLFSLSRSTIQTVMKRNNISLRKKSPQKTYNVNYFKSMSFDTCYWAGFIMADGCIRSDRDSLDIHLAKIDYHHLLAFSKATSGPLPKTYENDCRITFNGKWFPDQLEKYGVTPQKTYTCSFPNIPKKYWSNFIRGLFDGDGCISFAKDMPQINIVGTHDLLGSIREVFYQECGVRLKSKNRLAPIIDKGNSIGSINYSGKNATLILNWMYQGSKPETRLDRKYQKYKLIS